MSIGIQTSLPGLFNQFTQGHNHVGLAGEGIIAHYLEKAGYIVSTAHKRSDLEVFMHNAREVYVEVKTARYSSKKWQFSLTRAGHSDHRKSDIVILLCAERSGFGVPFVIPVNAVWDVKQISIHSANLNAYTGKYAKYRQHLNSLSLDRALTELGLIHE